MSSTKATLSRCGSVIFLAAGLIPALPAQQVTIVSPGSGAAAFTGQIMAVSVQATAGAFRAVQLFASDGFISTPVTAPPYIFSLTLPKDSLETVTLTAIGITAPDQGVLSPTVSVTLSTQATVTALEVESTRVYLNYVGDQRSVLIHGVFSDGTNIDIPRSTITFVSADPSIAIGTAGGQITGVGPGSTQVTANYGGKSVNLTVTVPTDVRGDFNGDGQVDQLDLQELLLAQNKPATTPHDARDLNGDGKVDALDARIETTLCTYPRCATKP